VGGICAVLLTGLAPRGGLRISSRLLVLIALILFTLPIALVTTDNLFKVTKLDRFVKADPDNPQGTAYWRSLWWQRLTDQVKARNLAFGLGFGENLSIYNPLIIDELKDEWPVRCPHNFNMTVFSRMGVVGAALWASILVIGVGGLFVRIWRGGVDQKLYSPEHREQLAFWLIVLIATWLNSSFGVLMEGPVLGVLFWFSLGFATGRSFKADQLLPSRAVQPAARVTSLSQRWALESIRSSHRGINPSS
jgi:O-antigen ligase